MYNEGGPIRRPDAESLIDEAHARRRRFARDVKAGYQESLTSGAVETAGQYSGILAARAVALAHLETPKLPNNRFLGDASDEELAHALVAAQVCAESQRAKVRESNLPRGNVRYGRFDSVPTSYTWLMQQLLPRRFDPTSLKNDFAEGYGAEASRWALSSCEPSDGKKSAKQAPQKIKGIWLRDPGGGRFVTQDGAVLSLDEDGLPTALQDLSRHNSLRAPTKADITDLLAIVARRVCWKMNPDYAEEEIRELVANISHDEILAGGWFQELIETEVIRKWGRFAQVTAGLTKLAIVETGVVKGPNRRQYLKQATPAERETAKQVAQTIHNAKVDRVRTSTLPWKRRTKFTDLKKISAGYAISLLQYSPQFWHTPLVKRTYRKVYLRNAKAEGLRILCPEQGHNIIRRVPGTIRGILLGNPGEGSRPFATIHGTVLTLREEKSGGYTLPKPITQEAIESRTNSVRPPTTKEADQTDELIWENVFAQRVPSLEAPAKRTRVRPGRR